MVKRLVDTLAQKGLTIATAESCTGGLIASAITDIPGSSHVFSTGLVTYSEDAKTELLGVPSKIINRYNVVSAPVAVRMAVGLQRRSKADFAIATTGLAGPGGGEPERPVGTVYVAVTDRYDVYVCKLLLRGDREAVRNQATYIALAMASDVIEGCTADFKGVYSATLSEAIKLEKLNDMSRFFSMTT